MRTARRFCPTLLALAIGAAACDGYGGSGLTGFTPAGTASSQVAFTVQPSSAAVGAVITPPVQVSMRDAFGATVLGDTSLVTLGMTVGTGTANAVLGGTIQARAVNGIVTFSNLTVDRAGTGYTLTATAATPSGVTFTTTSAAFNIQ
jgi:hypothetical protein